VFQVNQVVCDMIERFAFVFGPKEEYEEEKEEVEDVDEEEVKASPTKGSRKEELNQEVHPQASSSTHRSWRRARLGIWLASQLVSSLIRRNH